VPIAEHHRWHSRNYVDHWIDDAANHDAQHRPLLRQAVGLLPFATDASVRVLDLGDGYGEFSAQVRDLLARQGCVWPTTRSR
jgi:hypothetical protein